MNNPFVDQPIEEPEVCEWTHVTGFYYKPKCYEELAFHYKEGITLWCPHCGKPIKVVSDA